MGSLHFPPHSGTTLPARAMSEKNEWGMELPSWPDSDKVPVSPLSSRFRESWLGIWDSQHLPAVMGFSTVQGQWKPWKQWQDAPPLPASSVSRAQWKTWTVTPTLPTNHKTPSLSLGSIDAKLGTLLQPCSGRKIPTRIRKSNQQTLTHRWYRHWTCLTKIWKQHGKQSFSEQLRAYFYQVWWYTPIILALGRLKQEFEFGANLSHKVRPCLKNKQKIWNKWKLHIKKGSVKK
jgi:hypothetical protein